MCIPLLLEKLSSDVLSAKLDSLHTLVAAALNYGPVALEPFLEPLWTAIKKEVGDLGYFVVALLISQFTDHRCFILQVRRCRYVAMKYMPAGLLSSMADRVENQISPSPVSV